MKARLLCEGNDGARHYAAGDEYTGDGEWIRRLLINGLAEPLDEQAKTLVATPAQVERYGSAVHKSAADSLAVKITEPAAPRAVKGKA